MLGDLPETSAAAFQNRIREERVAGSRPDLLTALGFIARSGRFWLAAGLFFCFSPPCESALLLRSARFAMRAGRFGLLSRCS